MYTRHVASILLRLHEIARVPHASGSRCEVLPDSAIRSRSLQQSPVVKRIVVAGKNGWHSCRRRRISPQLCFNAIHTLAASTPPLDAQRHPRRSRVMMNQMWCGHQLHEHCREPRGRAWMTLPSGATAPRPFETAHRPRREPWPPFGTVDRPRHRVTSRVSNPRPLECWQVPSRESLVVIRSKRPRLDHAQRRRHGSLDCFARQRGHQHIHVGGTFCEVSTRSSRPLFEDRPAKRRPSRRPDIDSAGTRFLPSERAMLPNPRIQFSCPFPVWCVMATASHPTRS